MNKFRLFLMLRRNVKLAEKRSPIYEQNKVAKIMIYIMGGFTISYLIFIAIMLALIANDSETYTPYDFFFGLTPFLLVLDFFFRFIAQQTPAQLIKPYSLLPIPKYACVEFFIYSGVMSGNNLIWMAVTVPYAIMTMLFSEGLLASVGLIFAFQVLISVNSLWYMLVRALINQSLKWWLLPILVYAAISSPIYLADFSALFDASSLMGEGFVFWHPLNYALLALILWCFVYVNKRVQFHLTSKEVSNTETPKMRRVSDFGFLDRYGEIGQYLKLEVKSLMRNKNMRNTFIFSTSFMVILSLLISFTDIYSDTFSRHFWVVYTFVLYGAMTLIRIMSPEGNYIDGLMIHRENIVLLLKAKYYFYSAMLLLPLALMLPTVFAGKYSLLTLLSMAALAAGPVYCLFMQMAVYNRSTIPLNAKLISKGNVENNYFQVVVQLVAMFAPVALISILRLFLSETATFVTLLVIGLAFICLHDLWIRNIYRRFMARRYVNMEGFRASR